MGHTGDNSHTFGSYQSKRWGVFFTDNPDFAAIYGTVEKFTLNIRRTVEISDDLTHDFLDSLDAFDPIDRPIWQAVKHHQTDWSLFEDDLGERFVKFLRDQGYDSATFDESNEHEGQEFESHTIVVIDPSLIQKSSVSD